MRSTSWRALVSRSGVPMRPRKYFEATTWVAVCDQKDGISMSVCSKKTLPDSSEIAAVRFSQSMQAVGVDAGRREVAAQV